LHKQLSTKFKTSSVPTVRSFFFLLEGGGHRRLVPTARSFFFWREGLRRTVVIPLLGFF
jgi:hypothetical protein